MPQCLRKLKCAYVSKQVWNIENEELSILWQKAFIALNEIEDFLKKHVDEDDLDE